MIIKYLRELWKIENPRKDISLIVITLLLSATLALLPSPYKNPNLKDTIRAKAEIIEVDNSNFHQVGLVKIGSQGLKVKILNGPFKGTISHAVNHFKGIMEIDKVFEVGDTALVVINHAGDRIIHINTVDHYRLPYMLALFLIFCGVLLLFAGWTGLKALVSFAFVVLLIWKGLVPMLLLGANPIPVSLGITLLVAISACLSAGGISKRGFTALLGCASGIGLTCLLALAFGMRLKLHGSVMPFTESLLYAGFTHLDITSIFLASTFIASSGAIVDVAIDISASQDEIVRVHPNIPQRELLFSGLSVGKSVIGTMSNTLLLAYSGGYMGLLLTLSALGIPTINIVNLRYVSAEILHTLVGSIGMTMVAPLTALIGSFIFTKKYTII
ncbi:MAG: YibE/F family protein [Synergistetes bacterium]|nr:YibE/F family protein [Synergistota bacterium]MDW8191723.1 YibE/F family protein [Synergistota bacterium]